MKNEIIKIQRSLKKIKNATLLSEIIEECDYISNILLHVQKEWLNEKMLLDANCKLVDDKNFVINDIMILVNYINGDKDLEYQAKNIIKNYENKKVVNK